MLKANIFNLVLLLHKSHHHLFLQLSALLRPVHLLPVLVIHVDILGSRKGGRPSRLGHLVIRIRFLSQDFLLFLLLGRIHLRGSFLGRSLGDLLAAVLLGVLGVVAWVVGRVQAVTIEEAVATSRLSLWRKIVRLIRPFRFLENLELPALFPPLAIGVIARGIRVRHRRE